MFAGLGRIVYRYRWAFIIFWAVILIASAVFSALFSVRLQGGGFSDPEMESEQAVNALQRELPMSRTSVTLVFTDEKLSVDDAAFRQTMEDTLARIKEVDKVREITTFYNTDPSRASRLVSSDRHTTYASIGLDVNPDDPGPILEELRSRLGAGPPKAILGGNIVIYSDMDEVAHNDLVRAETLALPISLIVLVFIFGSVVAAGLPVAIGGVSVAATLAFLYLLAHFTDVSVFAMNITSMLGLGLGIDYSLLLVSRFREEMARDGDVKRSVTTTVARAGKTVFFSGMTVFIGLGGLMIFRFMILRSLAYGGMMVVVLSVLAAITLVPAILAILGPRINALAIRRVRHQEHGFWRTLANQVMKHPIAVLILTLAIILALASPFAHVRFGIPDAKVLPTSSEARQVADIMDKEFGQGEGSQVLVVLQSGDNVLSPANVAAGYELTKKLMADPRVARVEGLFNLDPAITLPQYQAVYANPNLIPKLEWKTALKSMSSQNLTFLTVVTKYPPMDEQSRQLVRDLRTWSPGGSLRLQVGGLTAASMDIDDHLYADFPLAIGVIVVATFVALFILFGSVVLPLKAVLTNALSILGSYGALVFVFQDGNFSNLLNFTKQGFIDSTAPVMLFCVLFGLSMDYEVFLLTRIKEAYDRTGDNTESVAEGLQFTGRIITSAALIMVAVTGSFAFTDLIPVKSIGLGAGVAILLDATIVRALLVPATMRLLGNWNWWAPAVFRSRVGKIAID